MEPKYSKTSQRPYKITLPLPDARLSPNHSKPQSRQARILLSKAIKEYREDAMIAALEAIEEACGGPGFKPRHKAVTAQATFYHAKIRKRDRMNLSCSLKPAWDGMQDAQLIEDDWGVTELPPIREIDKDRPRVEILVWPELGRLV